MKHRVDELLVKQGFFTTIKEAQAAVMAGIVYHLDTQQRIDTSGEKYDESKIIFEVKGKKHGYVSRGGLKLEKALQFFELSVENKLVLDIGSSTGGFTDCALKNGASRVIALDVGTNQLSWKLRTDERVVVMEQTNFRDVNEEMLPFTPDVIVTDVSFISLKIIIEKIARLFEGQQVEVIALIKPQFEVLKEEVGHGGIVRDEQLHMKVIEDIQAYAISQGFVVCGVTPSPITGTKGNKEYLIYLK